MFLLDYYVFLFFFFFSSRRRHTRCLSDWSSDVCSSDLNRKCWDSFYSLGEVLKRARRGVARSWPWAGRLAYIFLSIVFYRVYTGHGVSADNVRKKKGVVTKFFIRLAVGVYNRLSRNDKVDFRVK